MENYHCSLSRVPSPVILSEKGNPKSESDLKPCLISLKVVRFNKLYRYNRLAGQLAKRWDLIPDCARRTQGRCCKSKVEWEVKLPFQVGNPFHSFEWNPARTNNIIEVPFNHTWFLVDTNQGVLHTSQTNLSSEFTEKPPWTVLSAWLPEFDTSAARPTIMHR